MKSEKDFLLAAEIELCLQDKTHHIANHLTIKAKDGWFGKFKDHPKYRGLKPPQLKLAALLKYCRDRSLPARIIILKGRKTGVSTYVEADLYTEVIINGISGIVIAHDDFTAREIFSITETFHEHYDLPKPETKRMNAKRIEFEDAPGKIVVETANNVKAGTGLTPQYIHCSEVAKWARGSETAVSLFQAVADVPGTTVILESTAYGYDSLFQPMWEAAEQGCRVEWLPDGTPKVEVIDSHAWNGYIPFFIAWFDDPDSWLEFAGPQDRERLMNTLTEKEKILIDRFDLKPEQINWYRYILKAKCQNDEQIRNQEYPATPLEAFVFSGRPRFDHDALNEMPVEAGAVGELYREESWAGRIKFRRDPQGFLTVFRQPVPGHRYVIGVDVAEGILVEGNKTLQERLDASVAIVLDLDAMNEQVATLCGRIPEEYLVDPLLLLGEWYNWAYIVPEKTGYGQHVVIRLTKEYPADRLWHRMDFVRGARRKDIGFKTHVGNRNILIGDLALALHDRGVLLHDRRTVDECKKFIYTAPRGRVEAAPGAHDDHVFALALALEGAKHYPEKLSRERYHSPGMARLKEKQSKYNEEFAPRIPEGGY